MKLMVRFAFLFYFITALFLGVSLGLFVLNLVPFSDVADLLFVIYYDPQLRIIFGIIALALLMKNYIFAKVIFGTQQKGKIIAFDNPAGRVSVSLTAMEDLIRRVIARVPEVKEVKSAITAGKKGLEVESRLILNADVNIPEMTSKLQDIVKRKIQNTIGIEEEVIVRIHVVKIIPDNKARRRKIDNDDDAESETNVPFQGYRA